MVLRVVNTSKVIARVVSFIGDAPEGTELLFVTAGLEIRCAAIKCVRKPDSLVFYEKIRRNVSEKVLVSGVPGDEASFGRNGGRLHRFSRLNERAKAFPLLTLIFPGK